MRSHQYEQKTHRRIHHWINVALFGAIIIEFLLFVDHLLAVQQGGRVGSLGQYVGHVFLLLILVLLVVLKHYQHSYTTQKQSISIRQTDVLKSLLERVSHHLNNDMQIVVGNAELAEIRLNSGADTKKPIDDIAKAAATAVMRIDQLAVFSATDQLAKTSVDLNALLKKSATDMNESLPHNVSVRLELGRSPGRVYMEHNLFALCLTDLVTRTAQYLDTGFEVVLRTGYLSRQAGGLESSSVRADIVFKMQSAKLDDSTKSLSCELTKPIDALLSDSSALISLSGAVSVRQESLSHGAQITMVFDG